MTYNKEAVYDEQVAPLVRQLIAKCHELDIQMLATFALMNEDPAYENLPLLCTSYVHSSEWNSRNIVAARQQIQV